MVINKFRIKDIGPFKDVTYDLQGAQVVGVLGPNGVGKSTLLKILRWLLTGTMGNNRTDKLSGYYRQGATGSGLAQIDFEANGVPCKLKKTLSSKGAARTELTVGNDPKITTAAEVEHTMLNIMGADKHALAQAAFLPQGKLDELLFGTPSEREKLYIQLLNMMFCGTTSKYVKGAAEHLVEDIDILVSTQKELQSLQQQQWTDLQELQTALVDMPDYSESISAIREKADLELKVRSLTERLESLGQDLVLVQCEFDTVMANIGAESVEQLQQQLQELRQELTKTEQLRNTITERRNTHLRYVQALESVNRNRGDVELQKQTLEFIDQQPLPEPSTLTALALEQAQTAVGAAKTNMDNIDGWADNRKEDREFMSEARCERCGSVYEPSDDELQKLLSEARESYAALSQWYLPQHKIYHDYTEALKLKEHKLFEQQNKLQAAEKQLQQSQAVLDQYGDTPENPQDYESTNTKVRELNTRVSLLEQQVRDLEPQSRSVEALLKHIAETKQELERSQRHLQSQTKVEHDIPLEEMEAQQERRTEFMGRVQQSEGQLESTGSRLQEIDRQLTDADTRIEISNELRQVSELMAFDFIPHQYVMYKFGRMVEPTQEILQELNADFSIDVDPDNALSLVFEQFRDDQIVQLPMHKLSGGQRVRLAVSFLLAVQKDLVQDAGFMTLDEPSTHLDDDGKTALANMLRSIPRLLGSAGSQVWVVDHCPELEMSFDKVIKLEKQ